MNTEDIARVTHEANRAYCAALGDLSQPAWGDAPEWQRASAINGVEYVVKNPGSCPADSHENWLKHKAADGWRWGPVKDAGKKEHPCFVPYSQLPIEQRVKDRLFLGIVRALLPEKGEDVDPECLAALQD